MSWPDNAAYEAVLHSLFLFRETHGPEKLKDLLAQELGREAVMARIAAARKTQAGEAMAAEPARSSLTEDDEAAVFAALEFYSDESHYLRQGGKPSLIARDRGSRARKVLDALDKAGGQE